MGINALTVAWLSRLADKGIIESGASILEFGPQDVLCSRQVVEIFARKHCSAARVTEILEEMFDGEVNRISVPRAFYSIFGISKYRSLDLIDPRADWRRDCNLPFQVPEKFDITTDYGTAEHVFGIGAMFQSMHDATRTGGVMLHILPAFGDVDHGFFNIHPTVYLDLAAANNYAVVDMFYVDRWDIRDKAFERDLSKGFDFDALPVQMTHLQDRPTLQRMVTNLFVENYNHPDTAVFGPRYDGVLYDYCVVALKKNDDREFQLPVQRYYGGGTSAALVSQQVVTNKAYSVRPKDLLRQYVWPLLPARVRQYLRRYLSANRSDAF